MRPFGVLLNARPTNSTSHKYRLRMMETQKGVIRNGKSSSLSINIEEVEKTENVINKKVI